MILLLFSGCTWERTGDFDPSRCDPSCGIWQICYRARCESGVTVTVPPVAGITAYAMEIGRTEVTRQKQRNLLKEQKKISDAGPETFPDAGSPGPPCAGCPATQVSWHRAAAHCNAMTRQYNAAVKRGSMGGLVELTTCYLEKNNRLTPAFSPAKGCSGFRLPDQHEWVAAHRAGTTEALYSGALTEHNADRAGWYRGNSGDQPHPVALKLANPWGLFDMAGNVWEWTAEKDADATKKHGEKNNNSKVLYRVFGGSYSSPAAELQPSSTVSVLEDQQSAALGFRCVRTVP